MLRSIRESSTPSLLYYYMVALENLGACKNLALMSEEMVIDSCNASFHHIFFFLYKHM